MKKLKRMALDVTEDVALAIRLIGIKKGLKNGGVVRQAIETAFPGEIEKAQKAIAEREAQENAT